MTEDEISTAIHAGDVETLARYLLSRGADVNWIPDWERFTGESARDNGVAAVRTGQCGAMCQRGSGFGSEQQCGADHDGLGAAVDHGCDLVC
jgi:hypothetical protein